MSAKKKDQPNIEAMVQEFTSESAFFQPASTQVDKPASPLVVKYTTHCYPRQSRLSKCLQLRTI
jgi:hypothetical protein